jgi:spore cortex formation protein SpoVR/YcgB (stage V sporulation)
VKKEKNLLPYTTIKAATEGDAMAIQKILKHYEGYIAKLATKILSDEYGKQYCIVDKDMQEQLTTVLLQMILDFEI